MICDPPVGEQTAPLRRERRIRPYRPEPRFGRGNQGQIARVVEELLALRGFGVSREVIRCWVIKFGPRIAANLRRRRCAPAGRWHLDEMVVKIGGRRM